MKSDAARQTAVRDFVIPHVDLKKARLLLEAGPNSFERRPRDLCGQRFIHHKAAEARWSSWRVRGFESRDLEIKDASGAVAQAHVVRRCGEVQQAHFSHNGEILFMFLLKGSLTLQCQNQPLQRFRAGESIVLPSGMRYALVECSNHLQFLEVALPGDLEIAFYQGPITQLVV